MYFFGLIFSKYTLKKMYTRCNFWESGAHCCTKLTAKTNRFPVIHKKASSKVFTYANQIRNVYNCCNYFGEFFLRNRIISKFEFKVRITRKKKKLTFCLQMAFFTYSYFFAGPPSPVQISIIDKFRNLIFTKLTWLDSNIYIYVT